MIKKFTECACHEEKGGTGGREKRREAAETACRRVYEGRKKREGNKGGKRRGQT